MAVRPARASARRSSRATKMLREDGGMGARAHMQEVYSKSTKEAKPAILEFYCITYKSLTKSYKRKNHTQLD